MLDLKELNIGKKLTEIPKRETISYVDWVELIKFEGNKKLCSKRVLENVNVYTDIYFKW